MTRLEEISARLKAATQGEWYIKEDLEYGDEYWFGGDSGFCINVGPAVIGGSSKELIPQGKADAHFIAHAPSDLAYLLKEVEILKSTIINLDDRLMENTWKAYAEENDRLKAALAKARADAFLEAAKAIERVAGGAHPSNREAVAGLNIAIVYLESKARAAEQGEGA